jgi:hypothetical protein
MEALEEVIPRLMDSHDLVYLKPPVRPQGKRLPITKITQETTHKNTLAANNNRHLEAQKQRIMKNTKMDD